jgi:chemotaxis protein MotB
MNTPSKYLFFIKERIKDSKLFLHKIKLYDQKRHKSLNTKIKTYEKEVEGHKDFINKIKNETSERISYAKSEKIRTLIKNNEEKINKKRKEIEENISKLKQNLTEIKAAAEKKENNNKNTQKQLKTLSQEIKEYEKNNVNLKEEIKEKNIKNKIKKKEIIKKRKARELQEEKKQAIATPSNAVYDECNILYTASEEIIRNNLNIHELTEARNIYSIFKSIQIPGLTSDKFTKDAFIENTAINLSEYAKNVNQDINNQKEKIEKIIAENGELENEVENSKQDLVAMEDTNRRNSGDSIGGANFFVSFSDIISVLLCFFILFFAISKLDGDKAQQLASTFIEQKTKIISFNAYVSKKEHEMLNKVKELMLDNVSPEAIIESKTKTIKQVISGANLFSPGQTEISEDGIDLLKQKLEDDITGEIIQIIIEGHTDDKELFAFPENLKKYENNIRLSAARAVSVASVLEENLNLPKSIIGIRAYGSNRPLKPNTSDLFRALNRRVVIKIKKDNKKETTQDHQKNDDNKSLRSNKI